MITDINESTWKNTQEMSIIDYLLFFFENDEKKQEAIRLYDFQPKTLRMLETMMRSAPQMFQKISQEIEQIIAKGTINMHDILPIIKVIKDIYNMHIHNAANHTVTVEEGLDFIETLIILLIHENYIPVPIENRDIVIYMVETAMHLLESSVSPKQSLWAVISQFFKEMCQCFCDKDDEYIAETENTIIKRRRSSSVQIESQLIEREPIEEPPIERKPIEEQKIESKKNI